MHALTTLTLALSLLLPVAGCDLDDEGLFDRTAEAPRYLSQQRLTELFQQSLRADYKPIVHVARLRGFHGAVGNAAIPQALRELIKYCVKPAELFTREDDHLVADPGVIAVLARALHRRRMIRMTGLFATASRIQSRRRKEVRSPHPPAAD